MEHERTRGDRLTSVRGWCTVAAVGLVVATSCARQGAPPGGPEDRRPPVVVLTQPDTFAVLNDFSGPVRFVFDERLSERISGGVGDLVMVSPRTGDVRVRLGRNDVTVDVDGGFEPGRVYRVTLAPDVSDLFGNQVRDPFELVFSTGGELHPTALAGFAWDRLTADGMDGALVLARDVEDSTAVHVARADGDGLYAFRYLPPGRYAVTSFLDVNRNGELDPTEARGEIRPLLGPADTVVADVPMLIPDTSAAKVMAVQVIDSVTLVVRFDDALDPAVSVRTLGVGIQPDSGASEDVVTPSVERVYHVWEYNRWVDEVVDSFARLDSAAAAQDAARRDSVATAAAEAQPDSAAAEAQPDSAAVEARPDSAAVEAQPDSAAPSVEAPAPLAPRRPPTKVEVTGRPAAGTGDQPPPPPTPGAPRREDPLPQRRVVLRLEGFLPTNEPFRLLVTGVRNINGIPQGGGSAAFVRSPPSVDSSAVAADSIGAAAADTAAVDTLRAAIDSTAVDTLPAVNDSAAVDTLRTGTDSAAADKLRVGPDRLRVPRGP